MFLIGLRIGSIEKNVKIKVTIFTSFIIKLSNFGVSTYTIFSSILIIDNYPPHPHNNNSKFGTIIPH